MNGLRPKDWVSLEPGESLRLDSGWLRPNRPEHAVEARLTYDTRVRRQGRPLGGRGGDPAVALAELPVGVWTSEWVAY